MIDLIFDPFLKGMPKPHPRGVVMRSRIENYHGTLRTRGKIEILGGQERVVCRAREYCSFSISKYAKVPINSGATMSYSQVL